MAFHKWVQQRCSICSLPIGGATVDCPERLVTAAEAAAIRAQELDFHTGKWRRYILLSTGLSEKTLAKGKTPEELGGYGGEI